MRKTIIITCPGDAKNIVEIIGQKHWHQSLGMLLNISAAKSQIIMTPPTSVRGQERVDAILKDLQENNVNYTLQR